VVTIIKYRGTYRIFMPIDSKGKPTKNENDTYVKGKYKTEVYRYNKNTLAVQFMTTESAKITIQKLSELGVNLTNFIQGDFESVYLFPEKDLDKVNSVLKFQKKGAKISPKSVKTVRRGLKNSKKIARNE
jgi:16S rRNA U1498 N3-methylase RsmE